MRKPSAATTFLCCILIASSASASDPSDGFQIRDRDIATTEETLRHLAGQHEPESVRKIWVYFTDKSIFDTDTYEACLDDVRANLSPHALQRRAKVMPHLADFQDIPVHKGYIHRLEDLGAAVVRESRWLNAVSVRASLETLEAIGRLPFVQKLVPVRSWGRPRPLPAPSARPAPTQPVGAGTFDYGGSYGQLEEIGVVEAHNAGYSGAGVIVAMLDTGFDYDHPAFQHILNDGRLLDQWDFINDDGNVQNEASDIEFQHVHGTATWSVFGGLDEGQLIGAAFGASFLLYKTEAVTYEVPSEEDNWAAAAERADQLGADVISSSLGYVDWYNYEDMDGNTATVTIAADIAVGRGIVVCTSAGNLGETDRYYIIAPADGDSVIAVGAVHSGNELAEFSSRGPTYDGRTKPEVVARGVGVLSAFESDGDLYDWLSGTSMSCPLVAGSAALMIEAHPTLTPMQLREALMMTADNAENPDNDRGWGRIHALDAIEASARILDTEGLRLTSRLVASPNPMNLGCLFRFQPPAHVEAPLALELFDVTGRAVFSAAVPGGANTFSWDGRNKKGALLSPGVFWARLRIGRWERSTKFVIQR